MSIHHEAVSWVQAEASDCRGRRFGHRTRILGVTRHRPTGVALRSQDGAATGSVPGGSRARKRRAERANSWCAAFRLCPLPSRLRVGLVPPSLMTCEARSAIAGTADLRAWWRGRVRDVTRGDDHDASRVHCTESGRSKWRNPREVRLSLGIPVRSVGTNPPRLP
jgi:hypothetical protein